MGGGRASPLLKTLSTLGSSTTTTSNVPSLETPHEECTSSVAPSSHSVRGLPTCTAISALPGAVPLGSAARSAGEETAARRGERMCSAATGLSFPAWSPTIGDVS